MTKSLLNNYTRLFKLLIYQFSHIAKRPLRSYLSDATKRAGVISEMKNFPHSVRINVFHVHLARLCLNRSLRVEHGLEHGRSGGKRNTSQPSDFGQSSNIV